MLKIILDCFGGDHSPQANIEGAVQTLNIKPDLHLILAGDEDIIKTELAKYSVNLARVEILHAPDVVSCDEKPTEAIKTRRQSSLVAGFERLHADDTVSALVSIGSTGLVLVGGVLRVGRLRGVIRPAFCPIIPTMNNGLVGICDSGANVDCTPQYLHQFAVMGSLYMQLTYGVTNPRVALLNVGLEAEKGDSLHQEAYKLLANEKTINFVGNMESRDLLSGKYDLVVCDGFSGNVLIKSTEGACLEMLKRLKKDIFSSFWNKIGALFMKKTLMREKAFMNYQNYGGSVLLGTKKIIVKGHGNSKAQGVCKCILQAYDMSASDLCTHIQTALSMQANGQ